uniref:PQ-loop repeat-containing protein n=1 Tax=Strongyloides venezuelensis TaxID=75913 RepID=A0A0K0G1A8_STRVS
MIEDTMNIVTFSFAIGPIIPFLLYGAYFNPIQLAMAFYGAFIQILVILVSSIIWKFGYIYYKNITFYISILFFTQELFRILFYFIIRRNLHRTLNSFKCTKDKSPSEISKCLSDISFGAGFGIGIIFQILFTINNLAENPFNEMSIIDSNNLSFIKKTIIDAFNIKNSRTDNFSVLFSCVNLTFNILWTMLSWKLLHKLTN